MLHARKAPVIQRVVMSNAAVASCERIVAGVHTSRVFAARPLVAAHITPRTAFAELLPDRKAK